MASEHEEEVVGFTNAVQLGRDNRRIALSCPASPSPTPGATYVNLRKETGEIGAQVMLFSEGQGHLSEVELRPIGNTRSLGPEFLSQRLF